MHYQRWQVFKQAGLSCRWAHGFDGFKYWDYRDENIQLFGDLALVHSRNKYIVEREGKEITGMSMYTDVYIKENGEWKCVQAQITKLSPENYPGDETIVRKYDYRNNSKTTN
jgi:ketosteroid isomerase-like protein